MKIKVEIKQVFNKTKGVKGRTFWIRQDFLLKVCDSRYGTEIYASVFNDNIERFNLTVGDIAFVNLDIISKKFNDRYYTNVIIWDIEQEPFAKDPFQTKNHMA